MTIEPNSSPSQGLEHIPETLNGAAPKPTLEPSEAETPTQAIQLSPWTLGKSKLKTRL